MNKTKIFRSLKAKSPTILSCLAAAGFISTVILTAKATVKAVKYAEYKKEPVTVYYDNEPLTITPPEPTKKEIFKAVWKDYIPAAATGVGTLLCIFGANIISKRQKAVLASAHAMLYSQFIGYTNAVKERFGNEAHEQIIQDLVVKEARPVDIYQTDLCVTTSTMFDGLIGNEEILCYDPIGDKSTGSGYFKSTPIRILNAIIALNRNYAIGGMVSVNDYYDFLGLDHIPYGDGEGWEASGGLFCIDFDIIRSEADDDTLEYWIVNPVYWPEPFELYPPEG